MTWLLRLSLVLLVLCSNGWGAAQKTPESIRQAIAALGGRHVNPNSFPKTIAGFDAYLKAVGVRRVTARQMTKPNHPDTAERLGYKQFLPPVEWWPRGAALALVVDQLQQRVGEPITIRNWWRPAAYNNDPKVAGAKESDHLTAHSVDLDYASAAGCQKAVRYLQELDKRYRWLQLSLGIGAQTTHVGIQSTHGRRQWVYASAKGIAG